MQNFVRLGKVDTTSALASIKAEHWHLDTYLRAFPQGPFGETDSVILRFPERGVLGTQEALEQHLKDFDQHESKWLPVSAELPEIKKHVFDLARAVEATRIGRVLVNRIVPGGRIFRHADTPVHANHWCRFHIVLHALPGNDFYCGNEMVNMETGEVWFFKNQLEHEVQNHSEEDRIHLVVDLRCESIKH